MRRIIFGAITSVLFLAGYAAGNVEGAIIQVANGVLSVSDNTLLRDPVGDTNWNAAMLTWSVELDDTSSLFTYKYTFDNGRTDDKSFLSHMTVELSPNFSTADIGTGTTTNWELGVDGAADNVDGTLTNIYGLKWQADASGFTADIVTARIPIWGDIYLKDGSVSAYNAGYVDNENLTLNNPLSIAYDPIVFTGVIPGDQANISGFNWLATPDTDILPPDPDEVIPEPATMAIWGMLTGFATLFGYRKRKLATATA
ncbi:MAG: hypothetical protein COA78_09270 [Blastopirellula sp.]|nr:MAG: hypothetical protein COA78_09270 [Blastopirellula sp.]